MKNVFNKLRQFWEADLHLYICDTQSYFILEIPDVILTPYCCSVTGPSNLGSLLSKTAEQNICSGLQICLWCIFIFLWYLEMFLANWERQVKPPRTLNFIERPCLGSHYKMHEVWLLVCTVSQLSAQQCPIQCLGDREQSELVLLQKESLSPAPHRYSPLWGTCSCAFVKLSERTWLGTSEC